MPFQRQIARMDVKGAETPPERLVLVLGDLLVAEEDDLVVDEGFPHLGEGRVVEGLGEVDPEHLRAAGACDRFHLDPLKGHFFLHPRSLFHLMSFGGPAHARTAAQIPVGRESAIPPHLLQVGPLA